MHVFIIINFIVLSNDTLKATSFNDTMPKRTHNGYRLIHWPSTFSDLWPCVYRNSVKNERKFQAIPEDHVTTTNATNSSSSSDGLEYMSSSPDSPLSSLSSSSSPTSSLGSVTFAGVMSEQVQSDVTVVEPGDPATPTNHGQGNPAADLQLLAKLEEANRCVVRLVHSVYCCFWWRQSSPSLYDIIHWAA